MNAEEYEFYIDAFSTATMPMARLAEYLRELSQLLGSQNNVHFKRLIKGSVRVVAMVESEAIRKVRTRVQNARDPHAPDDVRRTYRKIDDMLREDNAVARLLRGTTNVVKFPGREAAKSPQMGPFTEPASFDGKIVRIGGTDSTAHALIETADDKIVSAECSRELAVQLAPYLYGAAVRLIGNARWERTELGEWDLKAFRAKEFTRLKADDFSTVIHRLREVQAEWRSDADPGALVKRLRGENGESR
jgi:hypothetical protein